MNFHALLGKLFKVSSALHLRVILDCLLLHFSFCFPSCFSYYAPLANSELTVNLCFFVGAQNCSMWGKLNCQQSPSSAQWCRSVCAARCAAVLLAHAAVPASAPHSCCVLQVPSALCFWQPEANGSQACELASAVSAWNSSRAIAA